MAFSVLDHLLVANDELLTYTSSFSNMSADVQPAKTAVQFQVTQAVTQAKLTKLNGMSPVLSARVRCANAHCKSSTLMWRSLSIIRFSFTHQKRKRPMVSRARPIGRPIRRLQREFRSGETVFKHHDPQRRVL
jgi:hypothetical protein